MEREMFEPVRRKLCSMLKYLDELESELPTTVKDYLSAGRILHGFVERKCQVAIECAIDAYEQIDNRIVYHTARLLITYGKRYVINLTAYLDRLQQTNNDATSG